MPGGGFYAVESGRISFRRDGNWYTDDELINNPRIALLFSRSIRRNPDGSFYLQVSEERASIIVEDTPYVVKAVEDDPAGGIVIALNDESREPLDPSTLEVGEHEVLYCRVKGGEHRARFLRTAYYHLSPRFEPGDDGFTITIAGRRHPIRSFAG